MNRSSFIKSLTVIGLAPRIVMELNNMPKFQGTGVWGKMCKVSNEIFDDTVILESFIMNEFIEFNFKKPFHIYYGLCEDDFMKNMTTVMIRQKYSDLKTKVRLDRID